MKLTYNYTQQAFDRTKPSTIDSGNKNRVFQFNIGETVFTVSPDNKEVEVPAKLFRCDSRYEADFTIPSQTGAKGPHQDYFFLRFSCEYTYTTRAAIAGGVVEREMSSGAVPGDEGRMILYKGATTVADIGNGNWSERLVRPFIIKASDIANRDLDTNWPKTGTAPTIDAASRSIVDTGGDGYNHI